MTSLNRVLLAGNLTRDPQCRETSSGMPVADMGMAINEKYKTKSGETKESTCFIDIIAWGVLAEVCAKRLSKGSLILVEGKLQFEQWETKTGDRRNKIRVRAERIQFLDGGSGNGETDE